MLWDLLMCDLDFFSRFIVFDLCINWLVWGGVGNGRDLFLGFFSSY